MTNFTYRQPTFAVDDVAGQAHSLHEEGFALVPGVLSPEEVADLRGAIDRLKPFGFDKMGTNEHYKCVFNRDQGLPEPGRPPRHR